MLESSMAVILGPASGAESAQAQALRILEVDAGRQEEQLQILASDLAQREEHLAVRERHVDTELSSIAARKRSLQEWGNRLQERQALMQQRNL